MINLKQNLFTECDDRKSEKCIASFDKYLFIEKSSCHSEFCRITKDINFILVDKMKSRKYCKLIFS